MITDCVPCRLKKHINPDTSVLVGKPPKPYKVLLGFIRFNWNGKNTNHYGKIFETKTNNYDRLINDGYQQVSMCKNTKKQTDYYLTKKVDGKR